MAKEQLHQLEKLSEKLIILRDQPVLIDRDVAAIYGVQTKEINQAVKNNPDKFPKGYVFELERQEVADLRSKIFTSSLTHGGLRYKPKAFTEKGLYMLATILRSKRATEATIEIIETFAAVKTLQRDLVSLHNEHDSEEQQTIMSRFSGLLSDTLLPELRPEETETTLELNFFIGKLTHSVKRKRREGLPDIVEEPEVHYGDSFSGE